LLLGERIDSMVQAYIRKVQEGGGEVSSDLVIGAATRMLKALDKKGLREHLELDRFWAHLLLKRMKFVQRKGTTAASKFSADNFAEKKEQFLVTIVKIEEIPPELILNRDRTGMKVVPSYSWTKHVQGARRVEIIGLNDKQQITAVFCGNLLGEFLTMQVIYKGKTKRCHSQFEFPSDWHTTHSAKHWSTEDTMVEYIEKIILPFLECRRDMLGEEKAIAVVMDNFKGQVTEKMLKLLDEHNIFPCLLPPNTTDRLQPMDMSVNKPAKAFMRKQFQL